MGTDAQTLLDYFSIAVEDGQSPEAAYDETVRRLVSELDNVVLTSPNQAVVGMLRQRGVRRPDELLARILRAEGMRVSPSERGTFPIPLRSRYREILAVIETSPDLHGIPSAECMAKHLPRDRRPTKAELDAAWARCS
jgi:hypothetical protein